MKQNNNFKAGFVAIIGSPNVGKSTLSNELLGQKISITSHKPQTTRHKIQVIDTTDNYQIILLDTPGIHIGNKKEINSYMNRAASSSLNDIDVVLWLVEAGVWRKEDERVLEHINKVNIPVILCINKIDKIDKEKLLLFLMKIANKYSASDVFPLSSFDKKDVNKLRKIILKYLPQRDMIVNPEYITNKSPKFVVAEFIREKLMRNLSDELPYDLTVDIEKFVKIKNVMHIYAVIFVDKVTQKNIVIGKNGAMIKIIGTESRKSIEAFLSTKVFLKLWVKVTSGWANTKQSLTTFGYD